MNAWQLSEGIKTPMLVTKAVRVNRRDKDDFDIEEIKYGDHPLQNIVYIKPNEGIKLKNKVLFFIPGGGWWVGKAKMFRFVGYYFAKLGYRTMIIGYRHCPKYTFPSQLEDVYSAFKKGLDRVNSEGFNGKVIVGGQSAGAHLGGMLIYNEEALKKYCVERKIFSGFFSISGPVSFDDCIGKYINKVIDELTEDGILREQANLINHVTGDENVPVLCIHGDRDPIVEFKNSTSLAGKVNKKRINNARIVIARGLHHNDIFKIFWRKSEVGEELKRWLDGRD